MSEKHDPTGDEPNADAQGEANPFAISPPGGSPYDGLAPTPPDLFEQTQADEASKGAPRVPPAEVDEGAQALQARPADVTPEPPKTIVSDRAPVWPSWTDGNLPPLIIYGPTSFRRTPSSVPLESAAAEPVAARPPAVAEPVAPESVAPEPAVSESEAPTLPDATVKPESADLDEIFDSIEGLTSPAADAPGADRSATPSVPPPTPMTLMSEVPPDPKKPQFDAGPATMSGAWPPVSDTMMSSGPPTMSGPATMSGEWPPAPTTRDFTDPGPETREGLLATPPEIDEPKDEPVPADVDVAAIAAPSELEPAEPVPGELEPIAETLAVDAPLADLPLEELPADELSIDPPADAIPAGPASIGPIGMMLADEPVLPAASTVPTPSTMAISVIPFEVEALPVAAAAGTAAVAAGAVVAGAVATGYAHDASHGQTAEEFFVHAHEDVEKRRGILSLGLLTRLAGLSGFLVCVAGMAIMLLACAGMTPLDWDDIGTLIYGLQWGAVGVGGAAILLSFGSILFRSWAPSAIFAAVVAVAMGGGWFALRHFQTQVVGFELLSVSRWMTYAGLGGIALTLLGGLIEHRRLREETAVAASLFSNVLASAGGGLLWFLSTGAALLGK